MSAKGPANYDNSAFHPYGITRWRALERQTAHGCMATGQSA